MTPEIAVRWRLVEIPAVVALVGQRVYLDKIPQSETYPLVLVQLVDALSDYHLRGGHRHRARVQVDAYVAEVPGHDAYFESVRLADAIHGDDAGSGLSGWFGTVGSPPFTIRSIQRIVRTREYESEALRLLRQRQEYWVYFQQP